jgi:co-chaperonin GroES (HSP10)
VSDVAEEQAKTEVVPLEPFGDRVICRKRKRFVTSSGLIAPETAYGSPRLAPWRVVAIGPEVSLVAVGDAVCLEAGQPSQFAYGGEEWCFVRQEHIHARLNDEELQSDETIHPRELSGRQYSAGGIYVE